MTRRVLGSAPRMTVPRLDDSPIPPISEELRRRAALVVCSRADDQESARLVLEALGLLDDLTLNRRAKLSDRVQPAPGRLRGRSTQGPEYSGAGVDRPTRGRQPALLDGLPDRHGGGGDTDLDEDRDQPAADRPPDRPAHE